MSRAFTGAGREGGRGGGEREEMERVVNYGMSLNTVKLF